MNELSRRAVAGARFLDAKAPGWECRIDLARLDMESKRHCILGQLAGSYEKGLRRFRLMEKRGRYVSPRAIEFGFNLFAVDAMTYERIKQNFFLTEAWKRQIELRMARRRA